MKWAFEGRHPVAQRKDTHPPRPPATLPETAASPLPALTLVVSVVEGDRGGEVTRVCGRCRGAPPHGLHTQSHWPESNFSCYAKVAIG